MKKARLILVSLLACLLFCFAVQPGTVSAQEPVSKTIQVQERFLILPVSNSAGRSLLTVWDENGMRVCRFITTLADSVENADWWSFIDVSEYAGRHLTVELRDQPEGAKTLALISNAADVPRNEPLYREKLRPQFHFSQMQGWNNDPNGMVFWDGEYHLCWQSNPVGIRWENMTWGHAVSKDLVHWKELPIALRPWGDDLPEDKRHPSMAVSHCFSGTAIPAWDVPLSDPNDPSSRPLLAAFTDTGAGEALAVSEDKGRTWKYDSVLVRHRGRDPQLIWLEKEKRWLIAVYEEIEEERLIAFYQSKDRKEWTRTGAISGFYECPNFYEMPVDGDPENTRWVLWAADGRYMTGHFDGKTFVPEHAEKHTLHRGNFYASLCFSNTPGRLIQIGWAKIDIPAEAKHTFNQTFTVPLELTLRKTPAGIRLFAEPVKELEILRQEKREFNGEFSLDGFGDGQLYDVNVTLDADQDAELIFGKDRVVWNAGRRDLNGMGLRPRDGKIAFRVLIDRPMFEICANGGEAYLTSPRQDAGEPLGSMTFNGKGNVEIWSLKSIHE